MALFFWRVTHTWTKLRVHLYCPLIDVVRIWWPGPRMEQNIVGSQKNSLTGQARPTKVSSQIHLVRLSLLHSLRCAAPLVHEPSYLSVQVPTHRSVFLHVFLIHPSMWAFNVFQESQTTYCYWISTRHHSLLPLLLPCTVSPVQSPLLANRESLLPNEPSGTLWTDSKYGEQWGGGEVTETESGDADAVHTYRSWSAACLPLNELWRDDCLP